MEVSHFLYLCSIKNLITILLFSVFTFHLHAKDKFNDSIAILLQGQGCGVIPTEEQNKYNIGLLTKLAHFDSTNYLIYKHLAMQYYYKWAKEKDSSIKETLRQSAIANNLIVLNYKAKNKYNKLWAINNLVLLYLFNKECTNAKFYYNQLNKKDKKTVDETTFASAFFSDYCISIKRTN